MEEGVYVLHPPARFRRGPRPHNLVIGQVSGMIHGGIAVFPVADGRKELMLAFLRSLENADSGDWKRNYWFKFTVVCFGCILEPGEGLARKFDGISQLQQRGLHYIRCRFDLDRVPDRTVTIELLPDEPPDPSKGVTFRTC